MIRLFSIVHIRVNTQTNLVTTVFIQIHTTATADTIAVVPPTNPSSDDDHGVRHGFGVESLLSLA